MGYNRKQRNACRRNGAEIGSNHRGAATHTVKHNAGNHSSEPVANRKDTHQHGGCRGCHPHGNCQILCHGDHCVADCRKKDHTEKSLPEGDAFQHFRCGIILAGGLLLLLCSRGCGFAFRLFQNQRRDEENNAQRNADDPVCHPPAEGRIPDQSIRHAPENQRRSSKAHHQHTGANAFFIREPGAHRRNNTVIGNADPEAADHPIPEIECGDIPLHPAGNQKSGCSQHRTDQAGYAKPKLLHEHAAQHSAEAEEAHG